MFIPARSKETAVILECGASRTVLAQFRFREDRLCLEQYAEEVFALQSRDEGRWLEYTRNALVSLRAKVRPPSPVVLLLPPHRVLTKLIKVPRVETAKREQVIRFEAEQGIPQALNAIVWDTVVAAEDDHGQDLMLVAAKLELIEPLCTAVQAAGFEPRLILPSPLATLAAYRLVHGTTGSPTLVLNVGERSTALLHVEGTRFAARTFSNGGDDTGRPQAEQSDRATAEATAVRLAQELTRSVLHFRRQGGMRNPTRVWFTGGSRWAGLAETLTTKLKLPVASLDLGGFITIDESVAPAHSDSQGLIDLAGAALTQLQSGHPMINLLPPRLRRDESRRARQPWLVAAAVLAVAALFPPIMHFRSVTMAARNQAAALERELTPLREREARNRGRLQQIEEARRQVVHLQGVQERRTSWLGLLADLQDRLGRVEDAWLDRLGWASAPGEPTKLALSGWMLDRTNPRSQVGPEAFARVKALLASLAGSPYVARVEAERFDDGRPGILKFDLVLVVDPARPL